ncbi:MAG TPA: pitrilysin family protein, partial [Candidatus Polarisedimenticolia bacterium]|nr:pitrilysin family protein [Candidatus Polarisedimenticolia bacterium]
KNGLTLLVVERHDLPLIEMRMLVGAGAATDPAGKEGVANLTGRLLRRGTATRSAAQFAEEVEFVGGTLEVTVGKEATVVAGEFASRDAEVAFNLMADMLQHPAFKAEEFDKERALVLADLVGRLDDPEALAGQAFDAWLFGSHPYGRPADGWQKSVSALTRDDVAAFYGSFYAPNNALLAVVGDIGAGQAAQKVQKYFGDWKKRAVNEPKLPDVAPLAGRKVLLLDKPDATQTQIRFGNIALRRADPDFLPLEVANAILGRGFTSWLVQEVRVKRGLTYGIDSRLVGRRTAGELVVETFSRNAAAVETVNVAVEQIRRLAAGPIPPEALAKARNYLAGQYPLRLESPDDLAEEILQVEFYGLGADYIDQFAKRIQSVGPESIKRGVRYLPTEGLAIVLVGPAAQLKEGAATLGALTVRPLQAALDPL